MSEIPNYHCNPDSEIEEPEEIMNLVELSLRVCHKIEECGASPELTEASVLASELHRRVRTMFPN